MHKRRHCEKLRDAERAEIFVADLLARAGWEVLARNYRRIGCELDVVVAKGKTLAIVEVKLRRKVSLINSYQCFLTLQKRRALERGARIFISDSNKSWDHIRFDLAVVCLQGAAGLAYLNGNNLIERCGLRLYRYFVDVPVISDR
ncbi:MAG: YraN family protein [Bdellovibrionota bacterium]